jgi:hypothetical protein
MKRVAGGEPALVLPRPVARQAFDDRTGQRNLPPAAHGCRFAGPEAAVRPPAERAPDGAGAAIEINGLSEQVQKFTPPHAGEQRQCPRRFVASAAALLEQAPWRAQTMTANRCWRYLR